MRRVPSIVGICIMLAAVVLPVSVGSHSPAAVASTVGAASGSGGDPTEQCVDDTGQPINSPGYVGCRGAAAALAAVSAACRLPLRETTDPTLPEDCALINGQQVSAAKIATYRRSWVHRALSIQRSFDRGSPLLEAQLPGTHNSFNASSYYVPTDGSPQEYYPTLTNQDPNQVYSITDQLDMDVRGIEIDLHWVPSAYGNVKTGGYWVTNCHGQSTAVPATSATVHVGCTDDRPLQSTLTEVRRWLHANPHQFLLIYLENQLDGKMQAHDIATSLLRSGLGKLVYTPPASLEAGHCAPMPYRTSEGHILRTGAQVVLVGNCGPGTWSHEVFTRGPKWNEGGDATTYGAKSCQTDEQAHQAGSAFRRWYEESPFLEALMGDSVTLTASATRQMVRCGVNLLGWDQLTPDDGRLKAAVWSWAPGQPDAIGRCAFQGTDSRFRAAACATPRHAACLNPSGNWHVTHAVGRWSSGPALCKREFRHSRFAVPPNGFRNAQLNRRRPTSRATVWLNVHRTGRHWAVNAARS